jgi:hypothetical protein
MDSFTTHRAKGQDTIVEASAFASFLARLGLFGKIVRVPLGNRDEDGDVEASRCSGGVDPILDRNKDDACLIELF